LSLSVGVLVEYDVPFILDELRIDPSVTVPANEREKKQRDGGKEGREGQRKERTLH
jgi:hypothetical protein